MEPGVTRDLAAAQVRQSLDVIQADLLRVLRKHSRLVGHRLIAHALIETTGSILAAIVEHDPALASDVDQKLGALGLFVVTAPGAAQ